MIMLSRSFCMHLFYVDMFLLGFVSEKLLGVPYQSCFTAQNLCNVTKL